jgi:hypothetical protein
MYWWITGNGVELRDLFKIKRCLVAPWTGSIMRRSITGTSAQMALTSDVATTDWYPFVTPKPQQYHVVSPFAARNYFGPKRNLLVGIGD